MEKRKIVAIVHYNTPELTEAAILSLRKHDGGEFQVIVLDNSDRRPFTAKMPDVKRLNNTKGRLINFDKELEKYPDREPRYASKSNFGSFKHMLSVQYLMDKLKEPFILLESDALLRHSIQLMWREEYAAVGQVQYEQPGALIHIPRYLPFLLFINTPICQANGARFFDPMRCWALQKGEMREGNWYDTGAAFMEDIKNTKPALVGLIINIEQFICHYKGGSWRGEDDGENQRKWLSEHVRLWK